MRTVGMNAFVSKHLPINDLGNSLLENGLLDFLQIQQNSRE